MAYPSDLVRTKNWGTELLTDSDLEGQYDLIINWVMAALNSSTGHTHSGSGNNGPKLSSTGMTATFGNGFTTVTAASGDYVLVAADVSDSNNTKKALVSDILTLAAPAVVSQAEMEAATNNTKMVTPLAVNWNPGVAKAWGVFDGTGTPTFAARYNFDASITDNGGSGGDYTLSLTTDMSSANYCVVANVTRPSSTGVFVELGTLAAGTIGIKISGADSNRYDSSVITVAAFGDQ